MRHKRVIVPLLEAEMSVDAGVLECSTSESLSLSVVEPSAGSVLLAGGISKSISEALRLLCVSGSPLSLSDSGMTFSLMTRGAICRFTSNAPICFGYLGL